MANTVIKGQIFGDIVKDYIEGKGILREIATISYKKATEAGTTVKFPVVPYLGDANEVVNGVATYDDVKDEYVEATFKHFDKGVKLSKMELEDSVIDKNTNVRAIQTAESLLHKQDLELLATVEKYAIKYETKELNADAILDAQGLFGQRLMDRELFIVANGKTISKMQKGITTSNLTKLNKQIYDATFKRFDSVEADVFYLVQRDVLELIIAQDVQTNVYNEADFHGEKINSDTIFATSINTQGRCVKVTINPDLVVE